ncbi:MAG: tetratricopeptide repeat protein [Proteobacteria bacterium]|nr:tetratricopeptide repeat protein [Pseudomonadota bacterium]
MPLKDLRHSLPAERDSFVGRIDDLRDLRQRQTHGARLISLVGPGGVGKTRLALRFAWKQLNEFPGGAWFCDLATATTIEGVSHAVARAFDVPLGHDDPITQLGNAIAGHGRCLVILDNFEQVASCAETSVGKWLDRAADARFVVTSRTILNIPGEQAVAVEPLPVSEGEDLFDRRAGAAKQDYSPDAEDRRAVSELVRLLDGLPLAIELSAARVRIMPPHAMLAWIGERFRLLAGPSRGEGRHATLRATFDWSWDLLPAVERSVLAQLSIFDGGFTLESASAVVSLDDPRSEAPWIPDIVQSLVEKSWVRPAGPLRFDLLASIKDYASQHLRAEGHFPGSGADFPQLVARRHWLHFASLTADQAIHDRCAEAANLVSACESAAAQGDTQSAVDALDRAWGCLRLRGPFKVGLRLVRAIDALAPLPPRLAATAHRVAASVLSVCGRPIEAIERFEHMADSARQSDDRPAEGLALIGSGTLLVEQGETAKGREALQSALEIAYRIGDLELQTKAHCNFGILMERLGQLDGARTHHETSIELARRVGERQLESSGLGNLGLLCFNQGRLEEAKSYYSQTLLLVRELGDRQREGHALCNLGLLFHVLQNASEARSCLESALIIAQELGHMRLACFVLCNLGLVEDAALNRANALTRYEAALLVARQLGDKRSEGQILGYLGLLHVREQRLTDGERCLGLAERLLTEVSDALYLALVLCGRAELEHVAGATDAAALTLANAIRFAAESGAAPESEVGMAIAGVKRLMSA